MKIIGNGLAFVVAFCLGFFIYTLLLPAPESQTVALGTPSQIVLTDETGTGSLAFASSSAPRKIRTISSSYRCTSSRKGEIAYLGQSGLCLCNGSRWIPISDSGSGEVVATSSDLATSSALATLP